MKPVTGWLRVGSDPEPRWIRIDAGAQLAPVAQVLLKRAINAQADAVKDQGVYRVRVSGIATAPQLDIARIANQDQNLLLAQVLRETAESVRVQRVQISLCADPPGAGDPIPEDRLARMLSEGIAACTEQIAVGTQQDIEIAFR